MAHEDRDRRAFWTRMVDVLVPQGSALGDTLICCAKHVPTLEGWGATLVGQHLRAPSWQVTGFIVPRPQIPSLALGARSGGPVRMGQLGANASRER